MPFHLERKQTFRGALVTYKYTPVLDNGIVTDVVAVLDEAYDAIRTDVLEELKRLRSVKWHITVQVRFVKYIVNRDTDEDEEVTTTAFFHGRCHTTLLADVSLSLDERIRASYEKIKDSIDKFTREGSGWAVERVDSLELLVARYHPLSASSYIPTPIVLSKKKAIINVNNTGDEMCFLWSVLAALFPQTRDNHRVSKYRPHMRSVDTSNINFPTSLADIQKFERDNPHISINLFCYEESEFFPLRITDVRGRRHHINLLLLSNADRKHYFLIANTSRLLSSLTKHDGQRFYCDYCLHRFSEERLLREHVPHCSPYGEQKTRLPETAEEKIMCFRNYTLCNKVPFTIYADFESFIVPYHRCDAPPHTSSTATESLHVPSGFSYLIVDHEGKVFKPQVVYRGENVVDTFLARLVAEERELSRIIRTTNVPLTMSARDEISFANAVVCHLCEKPLTDEDKVQNHCHMTGRFLGAAHNGCNLNFKTALHVPVFFHNLRGYDAHHLIQGLGKYDDLTCIATTSERFVSVSLGNLRFVDTHTRFSSLTSLWKR